MSKLNMVDAINLALHQEMERDPDVVILGEDVGKDGGVFRVTQGLYDKFGETRVMDTPLAELGIVGVAIGMAAYGLKPIAEIQFDGFMHPAHDQLINHASRIRNRTRGRYHVQMVLRAPYGGGIKALEHHSDSPESYFVHTPGLKTVIPSTPYEAKGLLISAIRDPDPVIFLEPKRVYRAIKEEVPEEEYTILLGKANVVQQGSDVTLIGYGAMLRTCKEAAQLAHEKLNASVELIDLRTLSPLDFETIEQSVKKTGRIVITHEAPRTLGMAAEISARLSEKDILSLKGPIIRITGYDTIMPMPKMENYNIPDAQRIVRGIEKVMQF